MNPQQCSDLRDLKSKAIHTPGYGGRTIHGRGQPFLFRAFGVNIASDIFFHELETTEGVPDVRIVLGETPQEIPEALVSNDRYQAAANQFLLRAAQAGRYYVADGKRIVVEPDQAAEPRRIRLFLLGTAFGALLMQRGVLPIHGSAVEIKGQAAIITGTSGAGKSTLVAALRDRGSGFLSDDVSVVTIGEGNVPCVQPGYPQQKLWKDSADNMGMDVSAFPTILSGMDKYAVAVDTGFCRNPIRLASIFELRAENRPEAAMIRLAGPDKIAVLFRHTYRRFLLAGLGLKTEHFRRCAVVSKQIQVCRLLRPSGKFSVAKQAQLVEELMAGPISGANPNHAKSKGYLKNDIKADTEC